MRMSAEIFHSTPDSSSKGYRMNFDSATLKRTLISTLARIPQTRGPKEFRKDRDPRSKSMETLICEHCHGRVGSSYQATSRGLVVCTPFTSRSLSSESPSPGDLAGGPWVSNGGQRPSHFPTRGVSSSSVNPNTRPITWIVSTCVHPGGLFGNFEERNGNQTKPNQTWKK